MKTNIHLFHVYRSFLLSLVACCMIACNGRLTLRNGIYTGETSNHLPEGYGECVYNDGHIYKGFWHEGQPQGYGTIVKGIYTYRGQFLNGQPHGYGTLTTKDSTLYSGEWQHGKRCGFGTVTDPLLRKIAGVWNADTLVNGSRSDSSGIYSGQFSRQLMANGHGVYTIEDEIDYEGHWKNDCRNGFGCSPSLLHRLRAGEWKADRFLGERVKYTSERIYGIDISKYQHGKGRRRYAINWAQIRIIHLGNISKKKVAGRIDFPVSFVYIKSTEGISLRNPYYKSDYRQARTHGFRVGPYHFFSVFSPASAQARYFLKHSYFYKGDFPPVLDVEPTHAQIKRMGGTEELFARLRTWLKIVHNATGTKPILYVSQVFVNRYLPFAPDIKRDYKVWIARYGEYKPDVRLVYWQLCPDGRVRGIHGEVDINVFNGYDDQFQNFLENDRIK